MGKSVSAMFEVSFQAPSTLRGNSWLCCNPCPVLSFSTKALSGFKDSLLRICNSAVLSTFSWTFVLFVSSSFKVFSPGSTVQIGRSSLSVIPSSKLGMKSSDFLKVDC